LVSQANRATRLIAYPVDGAIYAIDPDIPLAKQVIRFTSGASVPDNAHWRLNGKNYSNAMAWKLAVGKHTLALHSQNGVVLEQVKFEVKGASR
jgi:penicillin-binding protein 1C